MNVNVRELRDRAGKMIDQAQALVKTAEIEDRDFTEDEQKQYDGFVKESEALQARAKRMESLEGITGMLNSKTAPAHNKIERGDNHANAFRQWALNGDRSGLEPGSFSSIDGYGEGYTIRASNATDMNIGTAADGGNLVPTAFYDRIIARRDEMSLAAKLPLLKVPVGPGNSYEIPVDDEADGEFVATTEADTFDLDSPAMGKKQGALVLYSKYTDLSYQLLRASAASVEDFLVNWVGRGYAKTLNSLLLTEAAANGTAFKTYASATAIAFGEPEDIVGNDDLSNYMDDEAALAWVMRSSTHWNIKSIVGSDRQYAVNVDNGKSLLGYPVHYSQKASATAASAKDVYFGNWQYVAHAEGNNLTFMRDPYTVAVKGQVRLLWFFEADFQVTQAEAIGYGVHPSA